MRPAGACAMRSPATNSSSSESVRSTRSDPCANVRSPLVCSRRGSSPRPPCIRRGRFGGCGGARGSNDGPGRGLRRRPPLAWLHLQSGAALCQVTQARWHAKGLRGSRRRDCCSGTRGGSAPDIRASWSPVRRARRNGLACRCDAICARLRSRLPGAGLPRARDVDPGVRVRRHDELGHRLLADERDAARRASSGSRARSSTEAARSAPRCCPTGRCSCGAATSSASSGTGRRARGSTRRRPRRS